jgi:peptide/nickel transport system substrate-binding protein
MTGATRRDVAKGALMLGLGAATGTLFGATTASARDKPKRGGTFTAVFINAPASMDPVLGNNPGNDGRSYNLFAEKLLYQNFKGDYLPLLADKWELSDDGLTLTFHLKKGIKFQDGTDFDAAAVKANLDRARTPKPESRTAPYLTSLAAVDVVDNTTVKLTLKQRTSSFLATLASEVGTMVSPTAVQKLGADFSRAPVGTGPFRLTSWSGNRIEAVRWDGYWQKDQDGQQLPYLDHVEFEIQPNAAVQLVDLKSNGAQFGDDVLTQDYATVKANPDLLLVQAPTNNVMYSAFNTSKAPFDNINLRKAISHAVNREALAKIITGGYGGVAVGVESPGSWATGPELKAPAYDLALAKKAYAESGFKGVITVSIIQRDPDAQVAQLVQAMLKQAGIALRIEVLERTAWAAKTLSGDFEMTLQQAGTPRPDPDQTFSMYYARTATQNYSRFNDPVIFDLVDKARAEPDQAKRRAMYIAVQQRILDSYYQCFYYWYPVFDIERKSLQGMEIERSGAFFCTRAWIKT